MALSVVAAIVGLLDTNTSNKSAAVGVVAVGDLFIVTVMATGATGTFSCTDNNPDGLGTYTKVCDVFDNSSSSQMTILVRDAFFGSASNTTVTTTGIPGTSTGGGFQALWLRGAPKAGISLIRQFGVNSNVPVSTNISVTLPAPMIAGNSAFSYGIIDSTGVALAGPPQMTANYGSATYATPSFQYNVRSLLAGSGGTTWTYGTNFAATSAGAVIELDIVAGNTTVKPNNTQFPKFLLRGVV